MIRALFVIPAMFAGSACQTANVFDDGRIVTESGNEIIYVSEDYEDVGFDADSGDTVVVIMNQSNYPDTKQECADMGGTFHVTNRIDYCWDVDF